MKEKVVDRVLIIQSNSANAEQKEIMKTLEEYKKAKAALEVGKKNEKYFKDKLKEYDFDKIVFENEQGIEKVNIKQGISKRVEIDREKLLEYLGSEKIKEFEKEKEVKNVRIVIE